jgi:hypothetical protein
MSNKLLISTICSGALLLTACGGGGDSSNNQTSFDSKEKIDYTKKENIALVSKPIVAISNEHNNPIINIGTVAQEIHYLISNQNSSSYSISCQSGSTKLNNDGSVTLNNCKNPTVRSDKGSFLIFGKDEVATASGTIQSKTTQSPISEKTDLTLTNFNIDLAKEVHLANGKLNITSTTLSNNIYRDLFEVNQFTYKFSDKIDRNNTQKFTVNNYALVSNHSLSTGNIENIAQGQLNGEVNSKIFSVNFNAKVPFYNAQSLENMQPSNAIVEIEDVNNKQNSIVITETVDGQAMINAYANNQSVAGFPITIDWISFY